jgi:signal transduction histidine kinase
MPAAATVLFLIALLTWLSLRAINTNAELFDLALGAFDNFATLESTLHRDVLSARTGTLRNYDPLVREADALNGSLDRLRATAAVDTETAAAIERLATTVGRQAALVEQFKSNNALLQNSLAYFGRFSARLATLDQNEPLVGAVSAAAAAMLHLTLDTSPAVVHDVEMRLDGLSQLTPQPDNADTIQALLAHGRLLNGLLPTTDRMLKTLVALPSSQEQDAVRTMILTRQAASRATARRFRIVLYGTSLLLLACLIHFGLRLRGRAITLQRLAAFEHMVATLSTRFINAQPHEMGPLVDESLVELAARVGADRAYFIMEGAPPRVHLWSRKDISFPPGWPDRAVELAGPTESATQGFVRVPSVDGLPPGAHRDILAAAGVKSWACVSSIGTDVVGAILGFDMLRGRIAINSGELGLLRNTLNAIVGALRRYSLEHERVRLEARLQQARRMETVGALASGVAHNFNNIIGAILGHAEIAEAHLAADSRPLRNLDAIRRAGERARDLVDQILAFGRRRDARRRPVCVEALVAEAASLLHASLPSRIELVVGPMPSAAVVSGEPAQLQQVILNLCNNAAQAMDDAGRVEVDTQVYEIAGVRTLSHGELHRSRYVRVAVSDTGRGMEGATLERIFEPFFTTRAAGNGLGLATVREIVREHGGAMNVCSTPGQGSRFEVWLPCITAAMPAPAEIATSLPLGCGETVLVVDDERARLLRDEEMLAALGYEPVGFTGADDALAACEATPERFDALVVAHLGPAMLALDLVAALHAAAPGPPIVLATASANEISTDELAAAGIFEIVRRPLISTEIAAALRRVFAVPAATVGPFRK